MLDDADLDTFAAGLDAASFMINGQTCTLQSRILAPRSRYDEVVDAVQIANDSEYGPEGLSSYPDLQDEHLF